MIKAIDVGGLAWEQVQLVKEFVEFLRARAQEHIQEMQEQGEQEDIIFATHPSGVGGRLTRKEMTDPLEMAESDFADYLSNLEAYENRLARGEIQW